ncbi:PTS fructose transporter subunit IIB [Thermoanaerobacterium sp. DL9XJH110]|uniref:PTS fructose transporter subunit IIB n=1 Tax=Thermoanaerobacterium sp. DL9XJH110 TaxID=3386643 RepID=UPI003BB78EFB
MKTVKILTVCGSGTVSSSMIATKLKEVLGGKGYNVITTEVNPGGVESALSTGDYDFIAYTSPIHGNIDIPAINAVGFLTGFGEEEFLEEVFKVLKNLGK